MRRETLPTDTDSPRLTPPRQAKGRAARRNESGRYEAQQRELLDDGWGNLDALPPAKTDVTLETPKTIIARNSSPDISFDRSINAYRGCEHGCIYCFARPTHAYYGLSPGLDFETKLFAKPNASALLVRELAKPGYKPAAIAFGTNTDPYQPIERTYRITRSLLEVLWEHRHPVSIVTKSASVVRDLDLLAPMAEEGLVKVALSVTTLDAKLARRMEPRASTPARRMEALQMLSEAGIPTAVMVAPVIPGLTDPEMEKILTGAHLAGAREANFILLRLPLEIKDLIRDWLEEHYPDRASRVISLMRSTRDGKDYDSEWGKRMRGTGPYAWQLARRFEMQCRKLGFNREKAVLRTDRFRVPARAGDQLSLF